MHMQSHIGKASNMFSQLMSVALALVLFNDAVSYTPGPAGTCQPRLDTFCNSDVLCTTSMKSENYSLPLVARFDRSEESSAQAWRCYSPSSLSPDLSHYAHGKAYCTNAELATVLAECETNTTATMLFGQGTMTPSGALARANEPSLLYIPATATTPMGVLLAVAGGSTAATPTLGRALVLRRSVDGGTTWSPVSFPFGSFADPRTVGSFFQNQLTWDGATGTVLLTIGNITTHVNGCGNGAGNMESEDGLLQITSIDQGITWSKALVVRPLNSPTTCLAPTTGHGVAMDNPATPSQYKNRLLMAAVHNAYHGDVIVFSDDGGKTYNSSGTSLHLAGLDEVSIAQLPNGSLAAIIRNCMPGTGGCQMMTSARTPGAGGRGGREGKGEGGAGGEGSGEGAGEGAGGGKRFLWTTSDDGGATWATPRNHPDLLTPVCQGSITGYNNTLLFVGPYSTVSRHNLTALASDDNGVTFTRSLLLWPGNGGYTGLQCGLVGGDQDCGVIFDGAGSSCIGICFFKFASSKLV